MKILLQRLWEIKISWDDPIPEHIHQVLSQWRSELPLLMTVHIPRCYFPSKEAIVSTQLHGFSDASEEAYAGVIYVRIEYSNKRVHTSLVISKTKVSPIKRLSIPRLELCGAQILTQLLCRTMKILNIPLRPFLDQSNALLRVGGRVSHSDLSYSKKHPFILHGAHPLTRLIIRGEHVRLMHAGPTLLMSSLSRQFHVIGLRKAVRAVTRQCITCRRHTVKPASQLLGQFPVERVTPGSVFTRVGVDYAGPFQIKYGYVKKPTILKAYICLFVCLAVKAVHLELVSDLTTEAFIAALRRFTARRGYPTLIWSDHGTNFVGADRELKELNVLLTQGAISEFCSTQNIHSGEITSLWWDMGVGGEKCQESSEANHVSSQTNI